MPLQCSPWWPLRRQSSQGPKWPLQKCSCHLFGIFAGQTAEGRLTALTSALLLGESEVARDTTPQRCQPDLALRGKPWACCDEGGLGSWWEVGLRRRQAVNLLSRHPGVGRDADAPV